MVPVVAGSPSQTRRASGAASCSRFRGAASSCREIKRRDGAAGRVPAIERGGRAGVMATPAGRERRPASRADMRGAPDGGLGDTDSRAGGCRVVRESAAVTASAAVSWRGWDGGGCRRGIIRALVTTTMASAPVHRGRSSDDGSEHARASGTPGHVARRRAVILCDRPAARYTATRMTTHAVAGPGAHLHRGDGTVSEWSLA